MGRGLSRGATQLYRNQIQEIRLIWLLPHLPGTHSSFSLANPYQPFFNGKGSGGTTLNQRQETRPSLWPFRNKIEIATVAFGSLTMTVCLHSRPSYLVSDFWSLVSFPRLRGPLSQMLIGAGFHQTRLAYYRPFRPTFPIKGLNF